MTNENAVYFRKLAEEAKSWHVVTDTDLSWKAQEALEQLALYEEGKICERCGYSIKDGVEVESSLCSVCKALGGTRRTEFARI